MAGEALVVRLKQMQAILCLQTVGSTEVSLLVVFRNCSMSLVRQVDHENAVGANPPLMLTRLKNCYVPQLFVTQF